jgi:hypothetical protein
VGLASHYFLDTLPHWDYVPKDTGLDLKKKTYLIRAVLDLAGAVIITGIFIWFYPFRASIFWAAVGSSLPDALEIIYNNFSFFKWLKSTSAFHNWVHFKKDIGFSQGLPVLVLIILLTFIAIII